jgi:hypothetical protein
MERNWTEIAREYNGTNEQRALLAATFDRMEWHTLPHTMGAIQGDLIREAAKQLRLKKVQRVADSFDLAPFGLIGIENQFTNGLARIYIIDEGSESRVICTDFYPQP